MELSVTSKLGQIFKYISSSFMTIELLIITLLLFGILFINIKRNNKIVKIVTSVLLVIAVTTLVIVYWSYAVDSIDATIKWVLNYIYFPSMAMYFLIILFVTFALVYTILSKKMTLFLKRVNFSFFGLLYFFFINIISIALTNNIDFTNVRQIYNNTTMLSFIQISDMIFFLWIEFILIYKLYKYFQKKYD